MPTTLLKRLEQVAAGQRQRRAYRSQQGLAIFSDEELEDLCQLAQKAESAKCLWQPVTWTEEEMLILDRLEAKRTRHRAW